MATATQKVMETVELVEAILVELPRKDLLLSQQVCKFWKSVIDGSIKLQTLLCFLAMQTPTGTANPDKYYANQLVEPILATIAYIFHAKNLKAWNWDGPNAREEASWRRMLLFQPPITCFRLISKAELNHGHRGSAVECSNPDGVRMSDLLLGCDRMKQNNHQVAPQKLPAEYPKLENYRQLEEIAWS